MEMTRTAKQKHLYSGHCNGNALKENKNKMWWA